MARKPKTPTELAMKHAAKEEKLRRLEEKVRRGWVPPAPKEIKRAPDLFEEETPWGIQTTIFRAIAAVDGDARAKELQRSDAGGAPQARSRPAQSKTTKKVAAVANQEGEGEEECAEEARNKAWVAAAFS